MVSAFRRDQVMMIDSYMIACRADKRGEFHRLGAIFLKARPSIETRTSLSAHGSTLPLGAALSQLLLHLGCAAYSISCWGQNVELVLRWASSLATEAPGGVEVIIGRKERLSVSFSERIWRQVGGFDESLPKDEAVAEIVQRIIALRECTVLELLSGPDRGHSG